MKISELSAEQVRQYFLSRLPRVKPVAKQMVHCLWHEDRQESLSLNLDKGAWMCHAGCGSGGLVDFEMKFSSVDRQTAAAEIFRVLGLETSGSFFAEEPEAIYSYFNERNALQFQKLRYPGKRFVQRAPDDNGKWVYRLQA